MSLREFIDGFLKRSGAKVFKAMILAKIAGFAVSICLAKLLTKADYGDYTYAFTVISFLIPFMGFGAYQSLVYFGAQLKSENEKKDLFHYAFSRGILFSILLSATVILLSGWITQNRINSQFLLIVLSGHLITFTLVEYVRNYTRLLNRNDIYASSENVYNILLLASSIGAAWFFNSLGYAWAMSITPAVVGIYYLWKLKLFPFKWESTLTVSVWGFWKYGLFVSLGAVAAKMMYIVDIMTIGNILQDSNDTSYSLGNLLELNYVDWVSEQIAVYKVCSIIPIASFVLPLAIITSDFVKVSEHAKDKDFLSNYVKNMLRILAPISIGLALIFHFGGEYILLLFGEKYQGNSELISIFSLAIVGAFTLRIPFGNLLSAVGKANWNAYISFTVLTVNVFLNYYLVKKMGITGAAWATTILIWISGLINFICFRYYLAKHT